MWWMCKRIRGGFSFLDVEERVGEEEIRHALCLRERVKKQKWCGSLGLTRRVRETKMMQSSESRGFCEGSKDGTELQVLAESAGETILLN